jgi:hypothetical protein
MAVNFDKPVAADLESTNWLNMRDMYSALTRMVMVGALNRPLGSLEFSNPNGTSRTLTQWNGTADVQFDLTVKKLISSSGILEFAGSNCYLVGNNSALTLNADANDYMRYDRVNNIWRWVIEGAQRLTISPTGAGISSLNLGNVAGDGSSIFGFENNSNNVAPLEVTAQRTAAGADWTTAGIRAQRRVDATFMGFVQWGGDKNPAGVSIGAGQTPTAQGVPYLLHFKDGGRMVTDNVTDDGSTQLQVASLKVGGVAITGAAPAIVTTSKRQVILSGPVFSDGSPNLFPEYVGGLTLTTNSLTSAPLVVTAAGGFSAAGEINRVGVATTSLSWTLPANNGPTHLYVDVGESGVLTPSWTTSAPIYRSGGDRPTASGGSDVFNVNEMYMSIGSGAAALKVFRVYLGSCAVGADSIFAAGVGTAAYKAEYYGPVVSGLPAAGAQFDAVHNITPTGGDGFGVHAELEYKCLVANNGYAVGEVTNQMGASNGGYVFPVALRKFGSYVKAVAGSSGWILQNATTGASVSPPLASWSYRYICRRTW